MSRTTINQAINVTGSYDVAAALQYRNQHPLPSPLPLPFPEIWGLLRNTRLSAFREIDRLKSTGVQDIDSGLYIEFAILAGEAFFATSGRLGVSQNLKRFVRQDELPRLKKLRDTEPENRLFAEAMKANTGWVDSLLEVVERLKEERRREENRG